MITERGREALDELQHAHEEAGDLDSTNPRPRRDALEKAVRAISDLPRDCKGGEGCCGCIGTAIDLATEALSGTKRGTVRDWLDWVDNVNRP